MVLGMVSSAERRDQQAERTASGRAIATTRFSTENSGRLTSGLVVLIDDPHCVGAGSSRRQDVADPNALDIRVRGKGHQACKRAGRSQPTPF
jgi:hypothetical protein